MVLQLVNFVHVTMRYKVRQSCWDLGVTDNDNRTIARRKWAGGWVRAQHHCLGRYLNTLDQLQALPHEIWVNAKRVTLRNR